MPTRWSLGLVTALLVLPSLVVAANGSGQTDRVVDTVPLEGNIDFGYTGNAGNLIFSLDVPIGQFNVPEPVDRVRIEIQIHRGPAAASGQALSLWLCEDPCGISNRTEKSFEHAVGQERIRLETPVEGMRSLSWVVFPPEKEGSVTNISISGQAHLIDEPTGNQSQTQQIPSTPSSGSSNSWVRGAIAASLGLAGFAVPARLRRWWPTPLLGLYHRIDDDELLDHPKRREIHDIVTAEPGIHFSELERRTDTARGNLNHHLHRMLDANILEERTTSGYRCFFPRGELADELREVVDRVRSDTAQQILVAISDDSTSTVSHLSDKLEVAQSTISYHVQRLADAELVDRDDDGTAVRLSTTALGERVLDRIHRD